MDNNERLELLTLSATDFAGFKKKYKTLTLTDQTEFKHYIQKVQDYLILHEKSRIEDVTGFPPP